MILNKSTLTTKNVGSNISQNKGIQMKIKVYILILVCLIPQLNAGPIGKWAFNKAKDKTKEAAVGLGKEIYTKKREIRRVNEAKTNTKSNLTKIEDTVDVTKETLKDTAIQSFGGQENVDFVKRTKGHIKQGFINNFE